MEPIFNLLLTGDISQEIVGKRWKTLGISGDLDIQGGWVVGVNTSKACGRSFCQLWYRAAGGECDIVVPWYSEDDCVGKLQNSKCVQMLVSKDH